MDEPTIAWLIIDMRKMYEDGASNKELCGRATEIHDRIEVERERGKKDPHRLRLVEAEQRALDKLVTQIRRGRDHPSRDSAMKDYDDYVRQRKGKKSGP